MLLARISSLLNYQEYFPIIVSMIICFQKFKDNSHKMLKDLFQDWPIPVC